MPVKIFVGNIAPDTNRFQLRELFEQHGAVLECAIVGTGEYGFVHMESKEIAREAIKALDGCRLNGNRLNIELSTADKQGRSKFPAARGGASTVKIYVGNVSTSTTSDRLRELFAAYGGVSEADVLTGFGFVHMHKEQEAFKAIEALDRKVIDGNRISVELSTEGQQGVSKEHNVDGGRGIPTLPRSSATAADAARKEACPPPPIASAVVPCETHASQSAASCSAGWGSVPSDSFARNLIALYHVDRAAFEAYANDPLVIRSLDLPPLESDPVYYAAAPARHYYC